MTKTEIEQYLKDFETLNKTAGTAILGQWIRKNPYFVKIIEDLQKENNELKQIIK